MLYLDKYNGVWDYDGVDLGWRLVSGNTYHFDVGVINDMAKHTGIYYSDYVVKQYEPLVSITNDSVFEFEQPFEPGDAVEVSQEWFEDNVVDYVTNVAGGCIEGKVIDAFPRSEYTVIVSFDVVVPKNKLTKL